MNLVPVVVAIISALLLQFIAQPFLSWVKTRYLPQVAEYPQIVALQPFWGLAVGQTGQLLFLQLVERWSAGAPPLPQTLREVGMVALAALIVSPIVALLGFPTFWVARQSNDPWWEELKLAMVPTVIATPLWAVAVALIYRGALWVDFYPTEVSQSIQFVSFTLALHIASFEAIRFGLLGRNRNGNGPTPPPGDNNSNR